MDSRMHIKEGHIGQGSFISKDSIKGEIRVHVS